VSISYSRVLIGRSIIAALSALIKNLKSTTDTVAVFVVFLTIFVAILTMVLTTVATIHDLPRDLVHLLVALGRLLVSSVSVLLLLLSVTTHIYTVVTEQD
jgi:hypothetical protein